jgi:hypothetical protein
MVWLNFIRSSIFLVLILAVSDASAANWRFVNVIANKPWCDFEMPLNLYLRSAEFLTEVGYDNAGCVHAIEISGSITIDDIGRLDSLLSFYRSNAKVNRPFSIHLDSPGGSVSAALAIAAEMRDSDSPLYQMGSFVGQRKQCLSSCTFILAAGFQRGASGRVGIHRPRFLPGEFENMGYENLQGAYQGLYEQLSTFFRAANIHPSFVDAMWGVPSSDIRYLTNADLSFFRLTGTDLIRQEEQNLNLIRACGESGPSLKRDFMSVINTQCTESNGKVDSECFANVLDAHPYGACYKRMYGN